MKLTLEGNRITTSQGYIKAGYPILDAHEIGDCALVLYDYMAFSHDEPSRNLFAYDLTGKELWRVEDIGCGATDGYTNIISETPLVVGNFAGFNCTIDIKTGKIHDKTITK